MSAPAKAEATSLDYFSGWPLPSLVLLGALSRPRKSPKEGRAKEARLLKPKIGRLQVLGHDREPEKWDFDQGPVRPLQCKEERAPKHVQGDIDAEKHKNQNLSATIRSLCPRQHARPCGETQYYHPGRTEDPIGGFHDGLRRSSYQVPTVVVQPTARTSRAVTLAILKGPIGTVILEKIKRQLVQAAVRKWCFKQGPLPTIPLAGRVSIERKHPAECKAAHDLRP
jgi:hypothetical protein